MAVEDSLYLSQHRQIRWAGEQYMRWWWQRQFLILASDATYQLVRALFALTGLASERARLQRALFYRHLVVAPPLASSVRVCMACYFSSLDRSCCLFLFRISSYLVAGVVTITLMIYTVFFFILGTALCSHLLNSFECLISDGALLKAISFGMFLNLKFSYQKC